MRGMGMGGRVSVAVVVGVLLALTGCDDGSDVDAGMIPADSGTTDGGTVDSGGSDSGGADAGDAGGSDADVDAGDGATDPDGGIGGGAATSVQIQAARNAVVGSDPTSIDQAIDGAVVTYLKPALGEDVAGFFLQAEQAGPGLFVAVDPATLTPPAEVGQVVDLVVTEVQDITGNPSATAIEAGSFAVVSSGHDVSFLAQSLDTVVDLVSAVAAYDSEIFSGSFTITDPFAGAAEGHEAAVVATALITGEPNLRFRIPVALNDSDLHVAAGCEVTVTNVPVVTFFGFVANVTSYDAADVTVDSCPAPTVTGARALTDATTATVTFSNDLAASSVIAGGTQFTIEDSSGVDLAVSAASVSGDVVTLTTAPQTAGETYTVTVATTVTDFYGTALDGAMNTAMFMGYMDAAVLVINEVNAGIANMCDQIELRVVAGGSVVGYSLRLNGAFVYTFGGVDRLSVVATNDIVVVHTDGSDTTCRGGVSPLLAAQEATAVDQAPTSVVSTNYDAAYDLYSTYGGLSGNSFVLTMHDATGTMVDAAAFLRSGQTASGSSLTQVESARVAGEWHDPGVSYDEALYAMHAVVGITNAGDTAASNTVQRNTDADTDSEADWAADTAETWGTLNAGQTPL